MAVLPRFIPEQAAHYQGEYLLTHETCVFDPMTAIQHLQTDQEVMAVDIGGDKARCAIYRIGEDSLTFVEERMFRSKGGAGYLEFLERLAVEAEDRGIPVGISTATRMRGSIIERTVNLPVFFAEISDKYDADYRNLFGESSITVNDAVAGIIGATTRLAMDGMALRDVAFFICGSGLGASVISNGMAIHVEAAHVPLVEELNPFGQRAPCGVEGREFTCLDRVVAARAGIEVIYRQHTGQALDGTDLGRLYEQGDELVTALYESSALALAHAITGVMQRFAFNDSAENAVVLHGGNFEIARYRDAIQRHLNALPHPSCAVVFSRDLSANICLDGAAVMAVMHQAGEA